MVTIITSCFNRESTVGQTIDSVLGQDYSDIEYIIVDGASSDGTLAVVKSYEGCERLTKIVSEPDSGMYEAINKGIRMAKGDIVGLLHSDDFFYDSHVISDIVADVWGENSRTHVDMSKIYSFPFLMGELRISPDDIQRAKFKMFMELKIMNFLRLTGIDRPSIKEYADAMVTGFSKASLIPFIRISDNDLKSIIMEEVMRIFNKKLLFKKY